MKRPILAIAIIAFLFSSCSKEVEPLTKQEIKNTIDSMLKARIKESDEHARVDLEYRMKIEVKVKADSIINARIIQKAIADSAAKKPVAAPIPTPVPAPIPATVK